MPTLRYVAASLSLGLIAAWASENLFWSAPPADWTPGSMAVVWVAYALSAACALSAVSFTGCGGWRGLFLGGAILGFMVEGVVVDQMYEVFPFQLVWTPLAWHALVTTLAIGGVALSTGVWRPLRVALAYLGIGLAAGAFGLFWPLERPETAAMPCLRLALYLLGWGLAVPLGLVVLDRLRAVPRPHGAVLLAVPLLAATVWTAKTVAAPSPVRLFGPLMVGLTIWAMARLGDRGRVTFGPPGGARHILALMVPFGALAVLIPGYRAFPQGLETNLAFAMLTVPLGLGLWLACLVSAMRRAPR